MREPALPRQVRHLDYRAQDFGGYVRDDKPMIGAAAEGDYPYGPLDYVGNIWAVDERDATFDAVLCTEVFEHIPYPAETLREFRRLLKPGGVLILTAPSNCLRHFDPFFFFSGFSDRWFERFLPEAGFTVESLEPVGDYYSWMAVELARTAATHSLAAKLAVLPGFLYYAAKGRTDVSVNSLCMGYHVVARGTGGA